jgi:hypothetical protein
MVDEREIQDQYSTLRVIVFALIFGVPVVSLVLICLVFQLGFEGRARSDNSLFCYFLAIGAFTWAIIPIVERKIISSYHASEVRGRQLLRAAQDVVLVRFLIIGSTYISGLIITLAHGTFARFPYFYAFGICYSILFWPTEARFRRIVEQLEAQ